MEEKTFLLTFIAIISSFLVGGDFTSGSLSLGFFFGIVTASFAFLGVHYFRHGKLI